MFDIFKSSRIEKEIALPFKVVLELKDDGAFQASIPELPGCVARGRTKSEALKHISEAAKHYLQLSPHAQFEVAWEDLSQPILHSLASFYGRLVAASNRDHSLQTQSGDYGDWTLSPVSRAYGGGSDAAKAKARAKQGEDDADGLVDYTPQVYCLAPFSVSGAPRLYAGTSANGAIYESVDGQSWELAYATGEARVHCLAPFKNRLYAGTSNQGKIFCYTGAHWSLTQRLSEAAVFALKEFNGDLYAGTYPNGHIYASSDGVNWHLAYDTGQSFVQAFEVFQGHLYAASSRATGGALYRSRDGLRWEKVFESRDPNFYCLAIFQESLWLGTGGGGKLYRSLDGLQFHQAAAFEDEGIRAMDSFGGRLYLASEGRGRVYRSLFADLEPPQILDLSVSDVTSHTAVLRWRTDRPADARVSFGSEEGVLEGEVQSHALGTQHRVAISFLKALTRYHYQAFSKSPDHSALAFSEPGQFTTAAAESAMIQSASHPDSALWYNSTRLSLSWNSPEGITRFHSCLDREASTLPQPGMQGVTSSGENVAVFEGLDDGEWWFHLVGEDRAGNVGGEAQHFRVRIDTQALPPRVSSSTHGVDGAWSNRAKAHWSWDAPHDLSGIKGYFVVLDQKKGTLPGPDNGVWTELPTYAAELGSDGDWWLHVSSCDQAGNLGQDAAHYLIRLDRRADPPRVESPTHPDPTRWVNSSQVQMQWIPPQDASGVAGYYYLFDQRPESVPTAHSGSFTLGTQAAFSGRADGIWYFHIVSVDAAGNVGLEAAHYPVRIDTWAAAPALQSSTHPNGVWVSSGRAVVEIIAPDDLSGAQGYFTLLDRDRASTPSAEKGVFSSDTTLEFSGLTDGTWYLHAVTKDAAGNVGVEAAHLALRVDTEALPPIIASTSHPSQDDWYRSGTIDLVWDAPEDLSGVAHYFWIFDREADTVPTAHSGHRTVENRTRVQASEDGVWYFHVVTQDRAGNIGRQAAHFRVRVDTQALAPRLICPTHPDRSSWSNHTRPRFEWFEPEDSSGVVGYYYCFDRNPETLPTPVSGYYTTERYALIDRGLDEDGTWWFHVVTRDRAGNVGLDAAHYPINLDTQALPPQIQSSSHPDKHAWSSNPNPIFEWAPPEDPSGIAGYYYILNHAQTTVPNESSGQWAEEPRVAFSGLEDGVWTLHVVSKDRCGNVGTQAAHYSVRIDTQALPPSVSSPTHPEGAWVRNASPSFTWTPPQDLSGLAGYYTLLDREPSSVPGKEKGQFTTGTLATFNKLEDGVWVFHVVSVDQAGNIGTRAAHYSVHVDTQAGAPKVLSTTHPDPDKWHRVSAPHFSWTPPDDPSGVAGYYWAADQSPDTVPGPQSRWCAESQVTLPEHPDGEWWFHVATKDGAGNISLEAAHFRFRIDTQAPRPKIQSKTHPSPEDWHAVNKPIFVWEDGDDRSGIAGHYWVFDRQAQSPVLPSTAAWTTAPSVTVPPQKDGVWYFHLAAKDHAGNISEPAHYPCRIETEAPLSKLEPLPQVSRHASIALRWHGEDRVSGLAYFDVQVRENGVGEWRTWLNQTTQNSGQFDAADGVSYEFRVRGVDKAGNVEAFSENGPWPKITIDLSPPEPVKNISAKPGLGGSVALAWGAALDPISGISHYEIYRSERPGELGRPVAGGERLEACAFVDPGEGLADGAVYYYTALPVDKAGNRRDEGNAQASAICDRMALAPQLSSPTHPSALDWYNQSSAKIVWDPPADSSGIAGYYWSVDQSLSSVPGPKNGQWTEACELEVSGLKDGAWYVHVSSKDKAGNLSSEAGHMQLNVDLSKPPAPQPRSPSHPQSDAWTASRQAAFTWNTPQDPARIAGYYWLLDNRPDTLPSPAQGRWTTANSAVVDELPDGIWWFHVLAKDMAGNLGEQAGHVKIQIAHTPPPPMVSSPTHPKPGEGGSGREAVFHWSAPGFSEPIVAYHYTLDQNPETVPDAHDPRCVDPRAEFKDLAEGDWHFHVVSVDSLGRLGRVASHYAIAVRKAGSLTGQITKSNGILPADGLSLELFKAGKSVAKQATNSEGRFRFDGLEMAEYVARLEAPGQPPLLLNGLKINEGSNQLNLSTEVCAFPNPSQGAPELRFYILAKEPGTLSIKVYTEGGKVVAQLEAPAPRPAYVKVDWKCTAAEKGLYLYQATLNSSSGKVIKYPIRKAQIS